MGGVKRQRTVHVPIPYPKETIVTNEKGTIVRAYVKVPRKDIIKELMPIKSKSDIKPI